MATSVASLRELLAPGYRITDHGDSSAASRVIRAIKERFDPNITSGHMISNGFDNWQLNQPTRTRPRASTSVCCSAAFIAGCARRVVRPSPSWATKTTALADASN